jgi:hypothetical protein
MERYIKKIIAFTFLFLVLGHVGFYKKYIALFPTFENTSLITHFHATMMFSWLALLFIQPILILNKKTYLHKTLGKITYLIAPLVVLSMFLITNQGYEAKLEKMSLLEANAGLSVNIPDFFAFSILYLLAILYKNKPDLHGRYMVTTLFPIIGAALVRIAMRYFDVSKDDAFDLVPTTMSVVCFLFMVSDIKSRKYMPFLVALVILLVEQGIWEARYGSIWQNFAEWYVRYLV